MVEDAPCIRFPNADTPFAAQGEKGKEHGIDSRAHVDDSIITCLMNNAPHLTDIGKDRMPFIVSEGDDATDGRMALEERGYALVEHKVDLSIGEVFPQRAEQRRGQNGITHLSEADNEYLHNVRLQLQFEFHFTFLLIACPEAGALLHSDSYAGLWVKATLMGIFLY